MLQQNEGTTAFHSDDLAKVCRAKKKNEQQSVLAQLNDELSGLESATYAAVDTAFENYRLLQGFGLCDPCYGGQLEGIEIGPSGETQVTITLSKELTVPIDILASWLPNREKILQLAAKLKELAAKNK